MTSSTRSEIGESSDPPASASRRGTTFCFLWGMFLLLHQAMTYDNWPLIGGPLRSLGFAVLACALLVVVKPSSLGRFALLLAATIAFEWTRQPHVPNHIFFAFSASVTALASLAWGMLRSGRGSGPASLDRAMSLIRYETLIMYFFVVFHKLNHDYFNAEVSCAVSMYRQIAKWLFFLPKGAWVEAPTIVGVLFLEALIPIMLAIPRARVLGVGVGLAFHYLLSLHTNPYVYSYSAMMFALLAPFLPGDFLDDLRSTVARISARRLALMVVLGVAGSAGLLMTGLVIGRSMPAGRMGGPIPMLIRLVWMVLGLAAMAIFAATVIARRREEWRRLALSPAPRESGPLRPAASWLLIFPALVFLNGCCPYLGLKTETAFAMFANLRTEGGRSNHVFMTSRPHLAGYQEDLAVIIESSDAVINSHPKQGLCVTYFDLRRMASSSADPDLTLTYVRDGRRVSASRRADPTAEVFRPNPWPLNKLLVFRPVQVGPEPQKCRH